MCGRLEFPKSGFIDTIFKLTLAGDFRMRVYSEVDKITFFLMPVVSTVSILLTNSVITGSTFAAIGCNPSGIRIGAKYHGNNSDRSLPLGPVRSEIGAQVLSSSKSRFILTP